MTIIRVSILVDIDTEGVEIEDLRDDILDVAFEQATDNPKLFLIQELDIDNESDWKELENHEEFLSMRREH
jgi:hypothetical protein